MEDLTPRQVEILKAIIQEYTENAEAVGSEILEKKYKLGVSPATIRNEMVELTKKGYLKKPISHQEENLRLKAFDFILNT